METLDDALGRIAELYYDEIFKFCFRRVDNQDEAYDITQDTFLALIDSYKKIEPEKVRKWLYETAKNKIADHYRTKNKRSEYEEESEALDTMSCSLYDAISDNHIEQLKQKIISDLSEEELELDKDFYINNMSYEDLGEKYNVKKYVMYKRVSRLKALLKIIKEKYF